MFAFGLIWLGIWFVTIGLVVIWWVTARAIVRRSLKRDGLWDISLDRFVTEAMPKLWPLDPGRTVFLYRHITKKRFSESVADIKEIEIGMKQIDMQPEMICDKTRVSPVRQSMIEGLFNDYYGCCFRGKGWVMKCDKGQYPWWISF